MTPLNALQRVGNDPNLRAIHDAAMEALGGRTVDPQYGIIREPGRYEGEPWYLPYFWDAFLNGEGEDVFESEDSSHVKIEVTSYHRKVFGPGLRHRKMVRIYQSDQGFIHLG